MLWETQAAPHCRPLTVMWGRVWGQHSPGGLSEDQGWRPWQERQWVEALVVSPWTSLRGRKLPLFIRAGVVAQ